MTTYTAHFYTEADWAEITIEAETPELALQRARQIESEETETPDFQSYDTTNGVEYIEIWAPDPGQSHMADGSESIGQFESTVRQPIPKRIGRAGGATFSSAALPYAIPLRPTDTRLPEWQSDDRRLRLAARDLFEALDAQTTAAQAVIDAWAQGDLAGAVRMLDASLSDARAAIAAAKGGAS